MKKEDHSEKKGGSYDTSRAPPKSAPGFHSARSQPNILNFSLFIYLCINNTAVTVNTVARKFCRGDEISLGSSVASKSQ